MFRASLQLIQVMALEHLSPEEFIPNNNQVQLCLLTLRSDIWDWDGEGGEGRLNPEPHQRRAKH